ncbi:hypothetical protein Tco_0081266, partial [Tanacetum coccineum]
MTSSTKALIVEYASSPIPPSPPPSPLSPLSSLLPRIPSPPLILPPLHTSPTYARAPLGYRAAMVQLRAASPSTTTTIIITITTLVEESSTAAASRVMTAVEEVNRRVEDLAATRRQDAYELYVHHEDAQDNRALLRAQISLLTIKGGYEHGFGGSYQDIGGLYHSTRGLDHNTTDSTRHDGVADAGG